MKSVEWCDLINCWLSSYTWDTMGWRSQPDSMSDCVLNAWDVLMFYFLEENE